MRDELFEDLITSIKQFGAIRRGEEKPSRVFVYPDVKVIRSKFKLSQPEFASMLGISVKTVRNWEQKRREPTGAAKILLEVAAKNPDAVWDVVAPILESIREKKKNQGKNR
jgi:putative transcriptional regulator